MLPLDGHTFVFLAGFYDPFARGLERFLYLSGVGTTVRVRLLTGISGNSTGAGTSRANTSFITGDAFANSWVSSVAMYTAVIAD